MNNPCWLAHQLQRHLRLLELALVVLQQLEKRFRFADHKVNQFRSLAFPFTSDGLNPGVIRALGCLLPGQQQQQLAGQRAAPPCPLCLQCLLWHSLWTAL